MRFEYTTEKNEILVYEVERTATGHKKMKCVDTIYPPLPDGMERTCMGVIGPSMQEELLMYEIFDRLEWKNGKIEFVLKGAI